MDAGKTTLSEALLYATGQVRKLGRVDHGDAFLDTDAMERQRGITIFTEPAVIATPDLTITLLDTPGHVDFSAETERTLAVLDYAILVISGADGIQGHTETLWRLLNRYQVPTFVFVNKMDSPGADKTQLLAQLKKRFSDGCVDFTEPIDGERMEEIAMQNETAMDAYLDTETVPDETIRAMIARRELFPCYFGSALKMDGIEQFVAGFERFAQEPQYNGEFGARIYKVSHDAQGNRLTWLKVTGGELKAKMMLSGTAHAGDADVVAEDGQWHEKADQVRVYSGAKSTTVDTVPAGTICAVTGLTQTFPGEGLGMERDAGSPVLQPVLTYTLEPGECDIHKCLVALRELEDEDPLLHVVWQSRLEEVHLQLMGAVQLEIIQQIMHDRFGLDVTFGPGSILYKETIAAPVEGIGHFEPLRHYAETHVLLEPLPQGCGHGIRHRVQRGRARPQLAAPHHAAFPGTRASGRAHRLADHRYENHAADGPCASEAHGRRRFPSSHVSCDSSGVDGGEGDAAIAVCWSHGMASGWRFRKIWSAMRWPIFSV